MFDKVVIKLWRVFLWTNIFKKVDPVFNFFLRLFSITKQLLKQNEQWIFAVALENGSKILFKDLHHGCDFFFVLAFLFFFFLLKFILLFLEQFWFTTVYICFFSHSLMFDQLIRKREISGRAGLEKSVFHKLDVSNKSTFRN